MLKTTLERVLAHTGRTSFGRFFIADFWEI